MFPPIPKEEPVASLPLLLGLANTTGRTCNESAGALVPTPTSPAEVMRRRSVFDVPSASIPVLASRRETPLVKRTLRPASALFVNDAALLFAPEPVLAINV